MMLASCCALVTAHRNHLSSIVYADSASSRLLFRFFSQHHKLNIHTEQPMIRFN